MHCQEQETKMLWTAYMYVCMYVCVARIQHMCVCVAHTACVCECVARIQHVCVCRAYSVCVCVCVYVCVWRACTPLCPTVGERKLRKEDLTARKQA